MVYDMIESMRQMQREMDRAFARFFDNEDRPLLTESGRRLPVTYHRPLTDIKETDKEITYTIDMPGLKKEDITIDASENNLQIHAQKHEENKQEENGTYRRERRYTGFKRTFRLPENATAKEAKATYEDGVLTVSIPKDPAITSSKTIQIE